MLGILAQAAGPFWGYGIGQVLIAVVLIAACVALVYVALRQFGIAIPAWFIQCMWIVVVAMVVIFCIRFVLSL